MEREIQKFDKSCLPNLLGANLQTEKNRVKQGEQPKMSWKIAEMPQRLCSSLGALDAAYIVIDFNLDYIQRKHLVTLLNSFYTNHQTLLAFYNNQNERDHNIYLRADLFCKRMLPRLLNIKRIVTLLEDRMLDEAALPSKATSPYSPRMGSTSD